MSNKDSNNILEIAAGVFLGNLAYDNKEELFDAILGLIFLGIFALFVGALYWAATDFPAFWGFTSMIFTEIMSGIWWLLSSIAIWFWERFRAMYLFIQIPIGLFVTYWVGSWLLSGHRESAWAEHAAYRRSKGLAALTESDQIRKNLKWYPPRASKSTNKNMSQAAAVIKTVEENSQIEEELFNREISPLVAVLTVVGAIALFFVAAAFV